MSKRPKFTYPLFPEWFIYDLPFSPHWSKVPLWSCTKFPNISLFFSGLFIWFYWSVYFCNIPAFNTWETHRLPFQNPPARCSEGSSAGQSPGSLVSFAPFPPCAGIFPCGPAHLCLLHRVSRLLVMSFLLFLLVLPRFWEDGWTVELWLESRFSPPHFRTWPLLLLHNDNLYYYY